MRYFTKEWYELCQECHFHLLLKVNEKAEAFSEEYYQKLYRRKLREFLKMEKELSEMSADDVFGAETADPDFTVQVNDDNLNAEERLAIAGDIKQQILDARNAYSPEPYDEAALCEQFHANHEIQISLLKNRLPSEILNMVVDIRVLALDVAAKQVKKQLRIWGRANEKKMKYTMKDYRDYLGKNAENIGTGIVNRFAFHDSKIDSIRTTGSDVVLTIEPSGFTDIGTVTFRNALIIEQDGNLEGAWWLYEEIYSVDEGNEYHALVQCADGQLAYLTVFAADVEFK